jgi:peptidoglycan/LPS O-acetylase OafA/YrhL
MRALAALAVALFHFHGETGRLSAVLPQVIRSVIAHGYLGVDVFFVLSGFVIARSLTDARWSAGFFGRFVLRRSLRLDPPYWVAIALAAAAVSTHGEAERARVTVANVTAHVLYLQNLLGYPNLIDVFWTLCIEIQLYLAYCGLEWLLQERSQALRYAVLAATVFGSLSLPCFHPPARLDAVFVTWWYQFGLGALVCRLGEGPRSRGLLWGLVALLGLTLFRGAFLGDAGPAVCAGTVGILLAARSRLLLSRALGVASLVWLGQRSYSFYLLHALVGVGLLRRWDAWLRPSAAVEFIGTAVAIVASIAAAEVLYRLVEFPCLEWSRSLRRGLIVETERATGPTAPGSGK